MSNFSYKVRHSKFTVSTWHGKSNVFIQGTVMARCAPCIRLSKSHKKTAECQKWYCFNFPIIIFHLVIFTDKSAVKFSPKAFSDPSEYLDSDETSTKINTYIKELQAKHSKTFLPGIAETAKIGVSLEKLWVHSHHKKCLAQIPRRFFGTISGVLKFFPGEPLPQSYDHSNRHW